MSAANAAAPADPAHHDGSRPQLVAIAVAEAMRKLGVADGAGLLIAVSGGPDSAALWHLLHGLAADHRWRLELAHVDHGISTNSGQAGERRAVEELIRRFPAPLHWHAIPAGNLARCAGATGRSLEELARQRRYQFLSEVADRISAQHIVLGHHADDNVETVLMRLLSGSPGPHGIRQRRAGIIRPLLGVRRKDLERYLTAHELPYHSDPSNRDSRFVRNRLRAQLPQLLASVPGGAAGLASAAEWGDRLWQEAVHRARSELPWSLLGGRAAAGHDEGPVLRASARAFHDASAAVCLAALYRAIDAIAGSGAPATGPPRRVPRRFLEPLLSGAASQARGHGVQITIGRRWVTVARRESGGFVVPRPKSGYLLSVGFAPREGRSSEHRIRGAGLIARFRTLPRASRVDSQPHPGLVRLSTTDFPVVVRSARPGDAIALAERQASLKRLLGRWGVAPADRWRVPVVASGARIRAVAGSVLGYRDVSAVAGGNVIVEFVDNRQG